MSYTIVLAGLAATALVARFFRRPTLSRCAALMTGLLLFWLTYSIFAGIGSPGWWAPPAWWPSWPSLFQVPVFLLALALTVFDLRSSHPSVGSAALVLITAEAFFLQQPIGDVNYFSHRLLVSILLLCAPLLFALVVPAAPFTPLRSLWQGVLLFACSLGLVAVFMTDRSELGRICLAYFNQFALPSWLAIGVAAALPRLTPRHAA